MLRVFYLYKKDLEHLRAPDVLFGKKVILSISCSRLAFEKSDLEHSHVLDALPKK